MKRQRRWQWKIMLGSVRIVAPFRWARHDVRSKTQSEDLFSTIQRSDNPLYPNLTPKRSSSPSPLTRRLPLFRGGSRLLRHPETTEGKKSTTLSKRWLRSRRSHPSPLSRQQQLTTLRLGDLQPLNAPLLSQGHGPLNSPKGQS